MSVQRAETRLSAIIKTQFAIEKINDPIIQSLSDSTVEELKEFATSLQVDIEIDRDPDLHFIKIDGCHGPVLKMKDKIRECLAHLSEQKAKIQFAEAVAEHTCIRWLRVIGEDEFDVYSGVFPFEIEQAYQRNEKRYRSSDPVEKFEIDFADMKETDLLTGDVVSVVRKDLSQGMLYRTMYVVLYISHPCMYVPYNEFKMNCIICTFFFQTRKKAK